LAQIVAWKLSRGKFRPRLKQLAASNSDESVQAASRKAFAALREKVDSKALQEALDEICCLHGVGPATGSAILSVFSEKVPFMADEVFHHVFPGKRITYTKKSFAELSHSLDNMAKEFDLSPRDLSHALWAEQGLQGAEEQNKPAKKRKTKI